MLVKREQNITTEPIQNNMKQLNLVKNQHEVYECQGRFQVTTLFISQQIAKWQRKLYSISIKKPFMEELS